MAGSLNDINVLERSNLFQQLSLGVAPHVNFTVNGKAYDTGYYLADGIYPKWSTLIQTISEPQEEKPKVWISILPLTWNDADCFELYSKLFSKVQEATRKDVEQAFGVLQARFGIIRGPSRLWQPSVLFLIMNACIIVQNMIIEDEANEDPEAALIFDHQ